MTTINEERELWRLDDMTCVMVWCCAGAELQLRRGAAGQETVILRELYPMKSDLYERARLLHADRLAARTAGAEAGEA